jgi:hypothetical protein
MQNHLQNKFVFELILYLNYSPFTNFNRAADRVIRTVQDKL